MLKKRRSAPQINPNAQFGPRARIGLRTACARAEKSSEISQ